MRSDRHWRRKIDIDTPSAGVEVNAAHVHDIAEIEHVIAAVAREANGGVICVPDIFLTVHREVIIDLMAEQFGSRSAGLSRQRWKLPKQP